MRWFASYWFTVVICLAIAGVYWLSSKDLGLLSNGLDWLTPGTSPSQLMIPALVAGCYAVVRVVLHRVLAYTESAIDASPRDQGGRGSRRAAIGNAAYTAFGNPTGWWLAPFATTLGVASVLATVVRWGVITVTGEEADGRDLFITLLLTLAILYAVTVSSAMLFPDRQQSLRPGPEPELDPVLTIPESDPAGRATKRRFFGRTKANSTT